MAQPWHTLDNAKTPNGFLELRKRSEREFLITIDNRVLMNSSANRSELALGEAARLVSSRPGPRVLIGGLGMALTLRAALDVLPDDAEVIVAELNPVVAGWCRSHLAELTGSAVEDPRVRIKIQDVSDLIAQAGSSDATRFNAIIIDLYEGPHSKTDETHDPFYGSRAIKRTFYALADHGIFAIWGENTDQGFEKRLATAGFRVDHARPGRGGLRHVVYVAKK